MRDYGKVHTSFWTSETTRSMTEDGRTLALYLLTCPHNTIAGVFRLPDGYVCDDLQWSAERVTEAFKETLAKGFANRCETTKWVWINRHFEWNPPENPNQKKCVVKIAQSVPDKCAWKPLFIRDCADSLGINQEPLPNPSETLSKPEAVTGTEVNLLSGKPDSAKPPANLGNGKQKYLDSAIEVLEVLNVTTGHSYKPVKANLEMIAERMKEGATVETCRRIILAKHSEWGADGKMAEYLRPGTLFAKKNFWNYEGRVSASPSPHSGIFAGAL